MGKVYSFLISVFLLLCTTFLYAQNVGVGTSTPAEKLDVVGGVKIGHSTGSNAGTIRYNPTTNKFEGRDHISWKEFGGGGEDDWTKVGETPVANDAYDIYHSGNVGIGTAIPLTKLHVKGLGAIAIRAETANDSLFAIDAVNTTGIAIKARTSSNTKPAFYALSQSGLAIKAETMSDTMPAIWAVSDSSFAIKAETNSDEWAAIHALQEDSAGYALMAVNKRTALGLEGGNAAFFLGDLNMQGSVRNTGSLFGGSVAVNDGLTVGLVAGSTCLYTNAEERDFGQTLPPFSVVIDKASTDGLISAVYLNNLLNTGFLGDCRTITGVDLESTLWDFGIFPLQADFFLRGVYMGSVIYESAKIDNNSPYPNSPPLVTWWDGDGGHYSTWTFSKTTWNGTDPDGINWNVDMEVTNIYEADDDTWVSYAGKIYYNWGDTSSAPPYAAFGEIRASGAIYSHSTDEVGDVAEFFKVQKRLRAPEPGDIVSISKDIPNTFVLTNTPNDPLIAGVISENPSIYLNSPDAGEPVALTGRVKVKVNAEGGKIAVGDAITSSSVEGVGMKGKDGSLIIGYALEAFDASRTDAGKIWILLSRTQTPESSTLKIVQGKNFELGGVMISGAQQVTPKQKTVFVPWGTQASAKLPADVEFDDLVIDVTPYGGKASLVISGVNKEGFEVEVRGKSDGFKGFYYKVEIVSTEMEQPEESVAAAVPAVNKYASREDQLADVRLYYEKGQAICTELMEKSGKSLLDRPNGLSSADEVKKFKMGVIESWKKADAELYKELRAANKQLSEAMAGDFSLIREVRGQ